jgi:hypothetical protein
MKMLIHVTEKPVTRLVLDGNVGIENPHIMGIINTLCDRFPIFDAHVYIESVNNFNVTVTSHDNDFRSVYGELIVEYLLLTYKKPIQKHYTVRGRKPAHAFHSPIVAGFVSSGEDFNAVLEDFLAGTVQLFDRKMLYLKTQQKYAKKSLKAKNHKTDNFYIPDEV